MKLRISLLDFLIAVALVAGAISHVWYGRKAHQMEETLCEMRELAGEVNVTNRSDIHAIEKTKYGWSGNTTDWEIFLPDHNFQICFAPIDSQNRPTDPIRAFPIASGKSLITIRWNRPPRPTESSDGKPRYQQVELVQDGVVIAQVDNMLPADRIEHDMGYPFSRQEDFNLSNDPKLVLKRFQQQSPEYITTRDSPTWRVWIEMAK